MSVRRRVASGVVGVLALGLSPTPAQAATQATTLTHVLGAYQDLRFKGADPACADLAQAAYSARGGTEPGYRTLPADGVTREIRMASTRRTSTRFARANAVVQGRGSVDRRGAARLAVSIAASSSIQATNGGGTFTCTARNASAPGGELDGVTATRRSWLVVRSAGAAAGESVGELGAYRADWSASWIVGTGRSLTKLMPTGHYNLAVGLRSITSMEGSATSGIRTASANLRARVELLPIGTRRRLSGKGVAFTRAGHRSCPHNTVRVKLTSKAHRRAKRISLYVNGKVRRVLTGRGLQLKAVSLRRIPRASNGSIRAVTVTRSGSQRVMRSTSWPCA